MHLSKRWQTTVGKKRPNGPAPSSEGDSQAVESKAPGVPLFGGSDAIERKEREGEVKREMLLTWFNGGRSPRGQRSP
jgi:hypothetical protein